MSTIKAGRLGIGASAGGRAAPRMRALASCTASTWGLTARLGCPVTLGDGPGLGRVQVCGTHAEGA